MKRRIFLVLLILLLAVFMLSCASSRILHAEISCDTFSQNPNNIQNDFELYIGDKLYVELCSNQSTGFVWAYEMSGDEAIKEEGYIYQKPREDVPGAAGKEAWTFKGINEGNTEILMTYSQPWDGGIKNQWTYKINIVVKGWIFPSPQPYNTSSQEY